MKQFLKQNKGLIYILAATAAVVIVFAMSGEIPVIVHELSHLELRWVFLAGCAGVGYLLVRAATLYYYLRRRKQRIPFLRAMIVTGVGQFYSAITPSSSGGQPMQVFTMHKMGIPVADGTETVLVKYLGFEAAFLILGAVLWGTHRTLVRENLGGMIWLVLIGYLVNLGLMSLVFLSVAKTGAIVKLMDWLIDLGARFRLVHHPEKTKEWAKHQLTEYRAGMLALRSHPGSALMILLFSFLQLLLLMSTGYCVYRAFGLNDYGAGQVMTMLFLLFIAAAFVPLPGAAGAQEGGFYLFFRGMIPESLIMPCLACWRFFTYYLLLIMGFLCVVAEKLLNMRGEDDRR